MVVPGQQRAAPGHRRVAPAPALALAPERVPLRRLMRAAAVACGVQFGWALQLSLLTPYVQELGIAHAWASLVWLCGPLSGLLVQPLAGHMSDRCRSGFGRRRPFIAAGAATIALAVILIGYSADIGDILGDPRGPVHRPRAVVVFVIGFWLLDVGNNATQGPCRALLADLSGKSSSLSVSISFCMEIGILGKCGATGPWQLSVSKLRRNHLSLSLLFSCMPLIFFEFTLDAMDSVAFLIKYVPFTELGVFSYLVWFHVYVFTLR